MKNIFLLLLLFSGLVKAQIVNIPDANFKARLLQASSTNYIASIQTPGIDGNVTTYNAIDTNSDGEIQVSEALAIQYLDVSKLTDFNTGTTTPNIADITGINNFTNLKSFDCSYNLLTTFDVSTNSELLTLRCNSANLNSINIVNNINLQNLDVSYNQLTTLDVTNHINLKNVNCSNNQLTSINVSNIVNLITLNCSQNILSSLNVNNNINLTELNCSSNQLSSLALATNTNLTGLFCGSNLLTSLIVINNINLTRLACENNQLSGLGLIYNTNLTYLSCSSNNISSLDVSLMTGLKFLYCSGNNLSAINLNNNLNLLRLNCDINHLTQLNVSNNINLTGISCYFNQIATLDVSNLPHLQYLLCYSNQLSSLYLKNGNAMWDGLNFTNNPNLTYICADEEDVALVQQAIDQNSINCHVNSYCSFNPGGSYNTITGSAKYDANNNGCDTNDLVQPNIRVNINDVATTGASFTSNSGNYTFYTQAGNFEITPAIENPTWFNVSPTTATIPFVDNNNNVATQDFCIAPNGFHPDIEVVISPVLFARPGFEASYQITFRNKGNQTFTEGLVGLQFDDAVLDFVAASQPTFSLATNQINWMYTNLAPFESRSIVVTFNVNSPTATPAVNIGDLLTFTVSTFPSKVDENPQDNTFEYVQTVVGSYDPNDITCLEGDVVPPSEIGNYLHYAINFENTGNFPAENVVVKTEVDASKFDINSLQLMNANFPIDARITGNKVEFIFKNIQLPIGGHGHILLKIKTQDTLVAGNEVANRADIFFDYNAPIDTGMANTVFQTLSNTGFNVDSSVLMAPNPASNEVTINSDNIIKSIQLYDAQGRIIMTSLVKASESKLNISSYSKGTYFVKITTEKGITVQKLLKD